MNKATTGEKVRGPWNKDKVAAKGRWEKWDIASYFRPARPEGTARHIWISLLKGIVSLGAGIAVWMAMPYVLAWLSFDPGGKNQLDTGLLIFAGSCMLCGILNLGSSLLGVCHRFGRRGV